MEIITGYTGKPHVTSEQDRDVNIGVVGEGSYVLQTGMQLAAEVSSNNEIKIRDGVLMHQGCTASIKKNTYDSLTITNGSQGMKRIDLIVARYEKNQDNRTEGLDLKVIQGTPAESNPVVPEYTEEDILLLNRIKMLRMLDIPVSDIRKILYEKEALTSVLNTHLLKIKEEENRLRQNYFLCEELIKMDMSVTDLSEEMLDKMVSGKEEYIYQLERIKRQDRIQKIFDISKLIVCIVGGVIAVIMCVQLYLELCNTYMSAPFKVITFVLGLILVVSILRIIVCNETK